MPEIAVVLQARMGSTRLPGKVLRRLGPMTLLDHCVARLRESRIPVIVATTEGREDDPVEAAARAAGAEVFRGSAHDVLGRYLGAADVFGLSEIVRATADNPFVDIESVARVVALRRRGDLDHVVESGLPIGAAVEAVSVAALRRAGALVADPYDREHVTSFVRRDRRFRALRAVAPGAVRRPGLRLTVDTPEDLAFACNVQAELGSGERPPALAEIIRVADAILERAVTPSRIIQGA
jgi:spore coat polysaccharide biosynthesis protein SpsF